MQQLPQISIHISCALLSSNGIKQCDDFPERNLVYVPLQPLIVSVDPHRQSCVFTVKCKNSYLCVPRGEPPYRCKGRERGLIKSTFSAEKRTSAVATSSFSYFYFILSEWHYHPDPISHMERVKDGNFDIFLRYMVTLNTKLLGTLFIVHTKSTNLGYL